MNKIRCVYSNGDNIEFTTDDATNYKNIDRSRLESVVLFDDDKIIDTMSFIDGYTFAYRMRNIGKLTNTAREKYVILGMVNKNDQILHFIKDGNVEIIDTPEEFARYGKLSLTDEESI